MDLSARPVPGQGSAGTTRRRGDAPEEPTPEEPTPAASQLFLPAIPVDLSSQYTSGVAQGDYDNDGFADIVIAVTAVDGQGCKPVLLK